MPNELASSVATALNGIRVLVIEDIWIVAQGYVTLLENLGAITLGPVGSVAEAISQIESGFPIDAALVDMNLNGEMAYCVVDSLNSRGVPVVIATGYDVAADLNSKAYAILKKPVRTELLIKALRGIAAAR